MAVKSISLAAACVSMVTLTTTMLTTFGDESMLEFKNIILSFVGGAVAAFIITMSVLIIIKTNKQLKNIKKMKEN